MPQGTTGRELDGQRSWEAGTARGTARLPLGRAQSLSAPAPSAVLSGTGCMIVMSHGTVSPTHSSSTASPTSPYLRREGRGITDVTKKKSVLRCPQTLVLLLVLL